MSFQCLGGRGECSGGDREKGAATASEEREDRACDSGRQCVGCWGEGDCHK